MPSSSEVNNSMTKPILNLHGQPPYGKIEPQHVEPAIDQILDDNCAAITGLLEGGPDFTWAGLVEPL